MDYLFLVEKFTGTNSAEVIQKRRIKYAMLITVHFATHFRKRTPNVTLTGKNFFDEQEAFYVIKLNTYFIYSGRSYVICFLSSKIPCWLNGRGLPFIVHRCVYF